MYGWHDWGLFAMENVTIMYLSIVVDIALGESSFFIGIRIWDPIPVGGQQNPSGYIPGIFNKSLLSADTEAFAQFAIKNKEVSPVKCLASDISPCSRSLIQMRKNEGPNTEL